MNSVTSIRIWDAPADLSSCLEDCVERIEAGDVVLLRGALQRVGLWEEITGVLWAAVEEAVGVDLGGALAQGRAGFDARTADGRSKQVLQCGRSREVQFENGALRAETSARDCRISRSGVL